ncbi:MAG: alkaline phosphatase family protein, partial [Terracidiphilus sp.]
MRRVLPFVCIAGSACLVAAVAGCNANIMFAPSPPVPESTVSPIPGSPIQHIVVIMQENRSFDNLFNGFPGADTAQTGMNGSQSIALAPVSLGDSRDLEHSHLRWAQDWDNGNMDGFAQSGASPATLPYSYVPEKDVEEYWTLARQYVLGDRMFQSNT